jgi:hypothetical protein
MGGITLLLLTVIYVWVRICFYLNKVIFAQTSYSESPNFYRYAGTHQNFELLWHHHGKTKHLRSDSRRKTKQSYQNAKRPQFCSYIRRNNLHVGHSESKVYGKGSYPWVNTIRWWGGLGALRAMLSTASAPGRAIRATLVEEQGPDVRQPLILQDGSWAWG